MSQHLHASALRHQKQVLYLQPWQHSPPAAPARVAGIQLQCCSHAAVRHHPARHSSPAPRPRCSCNPCLPLPAGLLTAAPAASPSALALSGSLLPTCGPAPPPRPLRLPARSSQGSKDYPRPADAGRICRTLVAKTLTSSNNASPKQSHSRHAYSSKCTVGTCSVVVVGAWALPSCKHTASKHLPTSPSTPAAWHLRSASIPRATDAPASPLRSTAPASQS